MDDTCKLVPKLFVNKIVKKWMNKHIKVVSQLSKFVKLNK